MSYVTVFLLDAVHTNATPCLITAGLQSIGRYPQNVSGYFDGNIDQLMILFNRSKTPIEILADATLAAYYSMDNVSRVGWDNGPNQMSGTTYGLITGVGGSHYSCCCCCCSCGRDSHCCCLCGRGSDCCYGRG